MSTQHPDSAIVDRLGGPVHVAALCRVKPQAVSQWKRGGIPPARRDFLMLLKPEAFTQSGAPEAAAGGAQHAA